MHICVTRPQWVNIIFSSPWPIYQCGTIWDVITDRRRRLILVVGDDAVVSGHSNTISLSKSTLMLWSYGHDSECTKALDETVLDLFYISLSQNLMQLARTQITMNMFYCNAAVWMHMIFWYMFMHRVLGVCELYIYAYVSATAMDVPPTKKKKKKKEKKKKKKDYIRQWKKHVVKRDILLESVRKRSNSHTLWFENCVLHFRPIETISLLSNTIF